jgi:hypothetical protein
VTHCEECGFVYSTVLTTGIPGALRDLGPQYRAALERDPVVLRARPSPDVWSALEYACHVRDVLVVQRERLELALAEDCPTFIPMGRDERVIADRYNEQDPAVVVDQLDAAAAAIAVAFGELSDAEWERTGIYNYPAPAERSMAWLGRHTIHEGRHHLDDVNRVLVVVTE